jgi:hypothetical protein
MHLGYAELTVICSYEISADKRSKGHLTHSGTSLAAARKLIQ